MDNDVLDSLKDIGYKGPLTEEIDLAKALDGGPKSLEYTKLVHLLAGELKTLCQLEETVSLLQNADDSNTFLLELSSFLKELGCPYKRMVTGHISARLQSREDRILLLDHLMSELMAARMVSVNRPSNMGAMEVVVRESPTARDLKDILITLKFNKPPPNISAQVLFDKLYTKLKDTVDKEGKTVVGTPLYNKAIAEKEWRELEKSFTEMTDEYRLRRETLITRLECTIQSFEWSDRVRDKKERIQSVYRPHREKLLVKPCVRVSDVLAARTSLLHIEKTSSAAVRRDTKSDINKLIIGRVPDRGGRPSEQQPPPPEMPSWQQRVPGCGGGFGGGRGGGGGGRGGSFGGRGGGGGDRGGGRVQGGWSQGGGGSRNDDRAGSSYNGRPPVSGHSFQTFEVPPPGGYNGRTYHNQTPSHIRNQQQGYSQNQQYGTSGYSQQGYRQNQGRYQNEHDDRSGQRAHSRGGPR